MKKSVFKPLLGLLVLVVVAFAPQPAEAINISIENPYSDTMWAAITYYEDSAGKWATRGWYKVAPNSTRNLDFSSSTKRDYVYIHVHTSEADWGDSEDSIKRTVIKEAFKYYDGESCPAGSNRRQVYLDRWYVENDGVVYWSP